MGFLIIDKDEFGALDDKVGLAVVFGFGVCIGEDVFKELLQLDLQFLLFGIVVLCQLVGGGFAEVLEIGFDEELDFLVFADCHIFNRQQGQYFFSHHKCYDILNGDIDTCDNFGQELIPLQILRHHGQLVLNVVLDRQGLVLVVQLDGIVFLDVGVQRDDQVGFEGLEKGEVLLVSMQFGLRREFFDKLDVCAVALLLKSKRVALFVRVQLDYLYHWSGRCGR